MLFQLLLDFCAGGGVCASIFRGVTVRLISGAYFLHGAYFLFRLQCGKLSSASVVLAVRTKPLDTVLFLGSSQNV